MTAVMRTLAAPSGPRIPRVAVVRGGRILDEHLVREASSVTVGTSEQALIVVRGAPELPGSFELLERVGERYWLRFTDEMTGRISVPDGIVSLSDLRARAHTVNGAHRLLLSEDARGKVIVGETTFLFQLVVRPPIAPRPQLPLGVKSGLGLDWSLTIIAAFSFLLHFGVAGAMYSDWMDPVVAVDRSVAGLVDDLARLPKPLAETLPDPRLVDESNVTLPPSLPAPSPRTHDNARPAPRSAPTNASSPRVSDSDAASLADRAAQIEVDLIAARSTGPAVQRALDRSAVPLVDLTSAAQRNVGVTHDDPNGLKVTHGGPVEARRSSLPSLGGPTHRTGQENAGPETATAGPTLRVDTPPSGMNGAISDADRVVASLRPRFKKCYQDGLSANPTMSGKAVLAAKIGPNGEVATADVASNDGLSPGVTACLAKVLQNAQFTGNGSVTTLRVPVSLIQQK
jgi:hypothetical protein